MTSTSFPRFLSITCLSLVSASTALAAPAHRERVFWDDFDHRNELGDTYLSSPEWIGDWTVSDGVLIGQQLNPHHGATIRLLRNFADLDVEFNFRFNGGTSFNFVVDDQNDKSVHAGHICRLSISPKKIRVADDKTGSMDLTIRRQRQDETLPADKKAALDKFLSTKQAEGAVNLQPGQWYTLRVLIQGDVMTAYLDGKQVTSLQSPGFAHPTKTKFGFTVNGTSIEYDNLRIFSTHR